MPDHEQTDRGQLAILHRTSRIANCGQPLEERLNELLSLTIDALGCDGCLLYLPDAESGEIVLRACRPASIADGGPVHFKPGDGLEAWIAEHRHPMAVTSNAAADPRFRLASRLLEESFEALLSVPLIAVGEVVGALQAHYRQPREHPSEEMALLSFVGEQIGGAIAYAALAGQNARLKQDALQARQQLQERKTVERAKGLLQQRFGLSEDQAYQRLRDESRRRRLPMREVAEAVLLVEGIATRPRNGTSGR